MSKSVVAWGTSVSMYTISNTTDEQGAHEQFDGCREPADPRLAAVRRPGKIIAVHLSYAVARRPARTPPRAPSRTSSSRRARSRRPAASIERPAGTELLAFEGEIALVIGTAARRVALERGVGLTSAGSPPPTTSACTTCARTTRARTSARRAATASRRSARPDRRAADRPGGAPRAHLGQRRARAGGHDRRACSSRSRSSSPTCRSTSRSSPAT